MPGNGADRAAICIHLGGTASRDQQERLATQYCIRHNLEPITMVFHATDALKLVREHLVDVIVCAYLPADRASLAEEVAAAGGELVEARRRSKPRLDVGHLFAKMFDKGMSVIEIAELTDASTGEVRAELYRRGRRPK